MEGRRQRRERLRAEREAVESHQVDALARKRRLQYLIIGGFAAIAVIVALIVISQSGGDDNDGGGGGTPSNVRGSAQVDSELSGIAQQGQVLGDANAPITVTEFGDPQCPVCAAFSEQVAPELISSEVKGGNVKFQYQPFLIIGPDSKPAMKAALAAGEQGRFWNYIQLFYRNQGEENSGYVTDAFLTSIANAAGVEDIDKWNQSRNSPQWDSVIANGSNQAESLGFNGTPSILVAGPNGQKALSGFGLSEIRSAIQEVS
jgi:protein-disulfide isomerase